MDQRDLNRLVTVTVKIDDNPVFELFTGHDCYKNESTMCGLNDLPIVIDAIKNAANFCRDGEDYA